MRRVCEAVSTRAARLAASGIVALVKKINKLDGCSVAVDGSLYKLHPKFPERYDYTTIIAVVRFYTFNVSTIQMVLIPAVQVIVV